MDTAPHDSETARLHSLTCAVGALFFTAVVLKLAWVCDDAFITLRTVDNFLNGYGLRYNVVERVQTFTHPLWLALLLLPNLTIGHPVYATLALSVLCSVATYLLVVRNFTSTWQSTVAVTLVLISSKAFAEYSTSGLENPLSHLLVACFLCIYLSKAKDKLVPVCLVASLLCLNRLDLILLVGPPVALWVLRAGWSQAIRPVLQGFAPLLVWLIFALIYYGTPFPNTAYAKLGAGIERTYLIDLGADFYYRSFLLDPLTLIVIVAGLVMALRSRDPESQSLAAGVAAYGLYVVWAGGDFMSGRFLTSAFLVSVVLVIRHWGLNGQRTLIAGVAVLVLGLGSPVSPLRVTEQTYKGEQPPFFEGVNDERGYYAEHSGLWSVLGSGGEAQHSWAKLGRQLREARPAIYGKESIGMLGYYAGPDVYIIDVYGLANPFVSRLPATGPLRPGHFARSYPPGLIASLWRGDSQIQDSDLNRLYALTISVSRGPLFSADRLRDIPELAITGASLASHRVADEQALRRAELDSARGMRRDEATIEEHVTAGRLDLAVVTWRSRVHPAGLTPSLCVDLGATLRDRGFGRQALEVLSRCADENSDATLSTLLVQTLFDQGDLASATSMAKEVIDLGARSPNLFRISGDLIAIFGKPGAEVYYQEARRLEATGLNHQ